MREVWKTVPVYDKYEASNLGRIRSYHYGKPKIMKQHCSKNGYKTLHLRNSKGPKGFLAHRIVAAAFGVLKSLDDPLFINHVNGNKHDNRVENLERVTRSQNEKHAFKVGLKCLKGQNHNRSKLTEKQVMKIQKYIKQGLPASKICVEFGVGRSCIYGIKSGRNWSHLRE